MELKKKTPCLYTENRWQASSFALKVINEDCHAFRGQYDMANAIADETVKNIRNKVKTFQVHYEYLLLHNSFIFRLHFLQNKNI